MLVMADARIDALIAEDVPYIDLTTELLGIGKNRGRMTYVTREDCIVAGTDVNRRIAQRLGLSVEQAVCDGARACAGSVLMVVSGRASSLHAMWKVGQNVYDHLSAVATKTRAMVDAAHAANPACEILPRARASLARRICSRLPSWRVEHGRIDWAFPKRCSSSRNTGSFSEDSKGCVPRCPRCVRSAWRRRSSWKRRPMRRACSRAASEACL